MTEEIQTPETTLYGEFSSIFKEDGKWTLGIYKLPDGTTWTYNEPDALVLVQRNKLRVQVEPLTRSHDTIQLLDDTKHLYMSTAKFQTPEEGSTSFEVEMGATCTGTKEDDLYSGYTSFSIHDLEGGLGFGFLTNGQEYATLFSKQQTSTGSRSTSHPRIFAIYDEHPLKPLSEGKHHFMITYSKKKDYAEWLLDGERVNYQDRIPDPISSFVLSIGIKTSIDLGPSGSRSLQGQGVTGEWSQVKIVGSPA